MSDCLPFPVIGLIERGSFVNAYVAWNQRDLETCPLHEYLKTREAKHTLICADGSAKAVVKTQLAGVDWQRVMEVGLFIQAISAVLSLGNIPVRIRLTHTEFPSLSIDDARSFLLESLAQRPRLYTQRRSENAVQASLKRARSVAELASSISSEPRP
jgi:hypothetical protein